MMADQGEKSSIARASVRRRLWESLNLGPHDGTVFREPSEEGDRIILSLRPSLIEKYRNVTEFEGFAVEVRPVTSGRLY